MEENLKIRKQRGLFMEIQVKNADRNLLLGFSGELDHHGARGVLREVELAIEYGFVSVHLGKSRLRTETAAVVACCEVYSVLG